MGDLRFTSYNVKGLGTPEKRMTIARELRRAGSHVALLQETHFKTEKIQKIGAKDFPYAYHAASNDSKSKGVAIFILKQVDWKYTASEVDAEGRWLLVKGSVQNQLLTIAVMYAPNTDQIGFVIQTLNKLSSFAEGTLI